MVERHPHRRFGDETSQRARSSLAWLWLVVASIFVHALLPAGSPLVRTAGSAFSVSTSDVSLPPVRKFRSAERDGQEGLTAKDERASSGLDLIFLLPVVASPRSPLLAIGKRLPVRARAAAIPAAPARAFNARAPPPVRL